MINFFKRRQNRKLALAKALSEMLYEEIERHNLNPNQLTTQNMAAISIALGARLATGELAERIRD